MTNNSKTNRNIAAVRQLLEELISEMHFEHSDLKFTCRCAVYTCFLMEIEPYQMPLSRHFNGDLDRCQKREFMKYYFSLYMDYQGERFRKITALLENDSHWAPLLRCFDTLIDANGK